jgi:hypothetical protein
MRRFRKFILVLLAIAFPLQGYASFALPKINGPMESAMMNMANAGVMHDCCNDAETAAKTGKPCKSAQPCQSAGQILPISELDALPQGSASSVRFPRLAGFTLSFDPAATWRPPTQL